jgi:hypothetical protein
MGNVIRNQVMKDKKAAPSATRATGRTQGRLAAVDWSAVTAGLDTHGCAVIAPLFTLEQCEELAASYEADGVFRSRIVMARHGFGSGEYQYFSYPLPGVVSELRAAL